MNALTPRPFPKYVPDEVLMMLWERTQDRNDAKTHWVNVEDIWLYRMVNEIREVRSAKATRAQYMADKRAADKLGISVKDYRAGKGKR